MSVASGMVTSMERKIWMAAELEARYASDLGPLKRPSLRADNFVVRMTRQKLQIAWWAQMVIALFALPWGYFRMSALWNTLADVPDDETLLWSLLLVFGSFVAAIAALLFVLTIAIPAIAGLFANQVGRGPYVASLAFSTPWALLFFIAAAVDGVWPLFFAVDLTGLAVTSALLIRDTTKRATLSASTDRPAVIYAYSAGRIPPPPSGPNEFPTPPDNV